MDTLNKRILVQIFSFSKDFLKIFRTVCRQWRFVVNSTDKLRYICLNQTIDNVIDAYQSLKIRSNLLQWLTMEHCPDLMTTNKNLNLLWFLNDPILLKYAVDQISSDNVLNQKLRNLLLVSLEKPDLLEISVFAFNSMKTEPFDYVQSVIDTSACHVLNETRLPHVNLESFTDAQWNVLFFNSISKGLENFKMWVKFYQKIHPIEEIEGHLLWSLLWSINIDVQIMNYFFEEINNTMLFSTDQTLQILFGFSKMLFMEKSKSYDLILTVLKHTNFQGAKDIDYFWNKFLDHLNKQFKEPDYLNIVLTLQKKIGNPSHLTFEVIVGCFDPRVFDWLQNNGFFDFKYFNQYSISEHKMFSYDVFLKIQKEFGIVFKPKSLNLVADHRITYDLMTKHKHLFTDIRLSNWCNLLTEMFSRGMKYPNCSVISFREFWNVFFHTQTKLTLVEKQNLFVGHLEKYITSFHNDGDETLLDIVSLLNSLFQCSNNIKIHHTNLLLNLMSQSHLLSIKQLYDCRLFEYDQAIVEECIKQQKLQTKWILFFKDIDQIPQMNPKNKGVDQIK